MEKDTEPPGRGQGVEYTRWVALYENGDAISFLVLMSEKPRMVARRLKLPPWQNIRAGTYEDTVNRIIGRKVLRCPTTVHCIECRSEFRGSYNHYLCPECCAKRTVQMQDEEAEWAYATIVLGHCDSREQARDLKNIVYNWCLRTRNYYPLFRIEEVLGLHPWVLRLAMKDRIRDTGEEQQSEEEGLSDFMTALTRVKDEYRESFYRTCVNWTEVARRRGTFTRYHAGVEEGVKIYTSDEPSGYACEYTGEPEGDYAY